MRPNNEVFSVNYQLLYAIRGPSVNFSEQMSLGTNLYIRDQR
jgi:hypothetical protein